MKDLDFASGIVGKPLIQQQWNFAILRFVFISPLD
jgi:hypothetical protein